MESLAALELDYAILCGDGKYNMGLEEADLLAFAVALELALDYDQQLLGG